MHYDIILGYVITTLISIMNFMWKKVQVYRNYV